MPHGPAGIGAAVQTAHGLVVVVRNRMAAAIILDRINAVANVINHVHRHLGVNPPRNSTGAQARYPGLGTRKSGLKGAVNVHRVLNLAAGNCGGPQCERAHIHTGQCATKRGRLWLCYPAGRVGAETPEVGRTARDGARHRRAGAAGCSGGL